MLKLRRGRVLAVESQGGPEQWLTVELEDGSTRQAIADTSLHGTSEPGDELIVNIQALDLRLGSGGFDVVHANLTRGLHGEGQPGGHVMKLNYTSLQHAVIPVEERGGDSELGLPEGTPVGVLALHGQLAPLAWAFAQAAPGRRLGFVQTPGGALSGGHSHTVRRLRAQGLLAGHITAGASFGGELEAMTTAGALAHALGELGWDAAVCGPGPGIVGSGSLLGHGGMQALDSAHVALALGAPTLIVPRMSGADERPRHNGVSHHTLTVLELLLAPVVVAVPSPAIPPLDMPPLDMPPLDMSPLDMPPRDGSPRDVVPDRATRHEWRCAEVDLRGYGDSGLPSVTMGRALGEDPWFFAAALAGGAVLAGMLP